MSKKGKVEPKKTKSNCYRDVSVTDVFLFVAIFERRFVQRAVDDVSRSAPCARIILGLLR
jgi:hypothetical protein